MVLVFSNVEITPKFSINHTKSQKLYFEPQIFTNRNIYLIRKLLTKFRFKTRFYMQTLVKWIGIVTLVTQKVNSIYQVVLRATEDHQINENSLFFFNFIFQSICSNQVFLLVLVTIITQKFVIEKICQKCLVCHFHLTGIRCH